MTSRQRSPSYLHKANTSNFHLEEEGRRAPKPPTEGRCRTAPREERQNSLRHARQKIQRENPLEDHISLKACLSKGEEHRISLKMFLM